MSQKLRLCAIIVAATLVAGCGELFTTPNPDYVGEGSGTSDSRSPPEAGNPGNTDGGIEGTASDASSSPLVGEINPAEHGTELTAAEGDDELSPSGDDVIITEGEGGNEPPANGDDLVGEGRDQYPEVLPSDEVCDGVDNDLDGSTDEGLNRQIGCGIGACWATVPECVNGEEPHCVPLPVSTEVCDFVDNDCDGQTDENASTEVCDEVDNDCEGLTDEGFDVGAPCTVGTGTCFRDGGRKICTTDHADTVCDIQPGTPTTEVCDELDNDCDGQTDEDVQNACGYCGPVPSEVCDGVDNNCDGRTDEGFQVGTSCHNGTGACRTDGTRICAFNGIAICSAAPPGEPTDEVCNGVDDDCDDRTDEELGTLTCGLGVCQRRVSYCDRGQIRECVPGAPRGEEPDGLDNDCDNAVDDGWPCDDGQQMPCGISLGTCAQGVQMCIRGYWSECTGEVRPAAETADGLDNDCDGQTDEDFRCDSANGEDCH